MVASEGHRPERPATDEAPQLTDDIWRIAEECWVGTATTRPTIDHVCDSMARFVEVSGNSSISLTPSRPPSAYERFLKGAKFREDLVLSIQDFYFPALAISHDGKILACGGSGPGLGYFIQVRDLLTGELRRTLHGHTRSPERLAFFKNGSLASCSEDRTIRIWDLAGGTFRILSTNHAVHDIALSPDDKILASTSEHDAEVRLWDASTGVITHLLTCVVKTYFYSLSFSPDGTSIAAYGYSPIMLFPRAFVAVLWKLQSNGQWKMDCHRKFDNPAEDIDSSVRFGYCGHLRVAQSPHGPRFAHPFKRHHNEETIISSLHETDIDVHIPVSGGEFSPDGNWFMPKAKKELGIFDTSTGRRLLTMPPSRGYLPHGGISPDGTRIVTTMPGVLRMWILANN
jgi:WD40 repeat protein